MTKKKSADRAGGAEGGFDGILKGLGDLVEKLSDLAEKGEQFSRTGEFQLGDEGKGLKGVFGFSVKTGLGGKEVKVEPFGNISKDKATGKSMVHELREPLVDVFEEEDHVLIVAEMPGIEARGCSSRGPGRHPDSLGKKGGQEISQGDTPSGKLSKGQTLGLLPTRNC